MPLFDEGGSGGTNALALYWNESKPTEGKEIAQFLLKPPRYVLLGFVDQTSVRRDASQLVEDLLRQRYGPTFKMLNRSSSSSAIP